MVVISMGIIACLHKTVRGKRFWETRQEKYRKTLDTTSFIKSKGYTVIEMWECHFKAYCNNHPDIKPIIQESRPKFAQGHRGGLSHEQIIKYVRSDDLFGMVECDIEVPDEWDPEFRQQTNLSPKRILCGNVSLVLQCRGQLRPYRRAHADPC